MKTLQYTYIAIAGLLLAMGISSCGKKFDLMPPDGIIRENYWQTKEQVHAAVIGCYASLMGDPTGNERNLAEVFFVWGEIRGDMVNPSLGTRAEENEIFNISTQATNSIVNWRPVYNTINYCNTVIDFAPTVLAKDQTFTQQMLDGYIAEVKALRALMYFYLVRSFGDVPLKLKSTSSDEEIEQLAKTPQAEVLAQIVRDLGEAEGKALTTYGDPSKDKGRITRYTINTIQADVALWMENYNEAITACNKVISSRSFGLIAPSTAWFSTLYRTGNSNESIFEIQFNQQKLNTFYPMLAIASSRRYVAANRVMDLVYTTEENFLTGTKDIRSDGASVRAEDNVIWKYVGNNSEDMIAQNDSYTHWFFYRYADVLLMKAEALAQLDGRGQEVLDLVTMIRQRAGAPEATNNNPDINNKEELDLFILEERAREFAFEGKRWYDVLRYVKKNNYANIRFLQDMVAGIVPASSVRTAQAKMLDHNSHYFPIYFYELQTNKQLVQNPFYK
ncbi:MAG: RagB/SusD family nutrient uptake outer membrane protein [Niabella sp.]